jgi:hypothetical protein
MSVAGESPIFNLCHKDKHLVTNDNFFRSKSHAALPDFFRSISARKNTEHSEEVGKWRKSSVFIGRQKSTKKAAQKPLFFRINVIFHVVDSGSSGGI